MGCKSNELRLAEEAEASALRLASRGEMELAEGQLKLGRIMRDVDRELRGVDLDAAERRLRNRRERESIQRAKDEARREQLKVIPRGWRLTDIEAAVAPGKTRVTLRLDDDVLRWFRKMGPGYQTRINTVLRAYWQAKADGAI